MYIDLKKTLRSVERCLPENGPPTSKQLYRMYDCVLRLRSQLLSTIYDMETFGTMERQEEDCIAGNRSVGKHNGAVVVLTFAEPLPAMKELTAAVEEHWLAMLQGAIREAARQGPLPYFEKAFVQIEITTPRGTDNSRVWDTSNRAINVIINNLKGVFFLDDDLEYMAFSVVGRWGEKGVTIVRISAFDESRQIGPSDFCHGDGKTMRF